jgi:hypothetical protein
MLTRCVRLAVVNYVFVEPKPGIVAHSARSLLLATNEGSSVSEEASILSTLD